MVHGDMVLVIEYVKHHFRLKNQYSFVGCTLTKHLPSIIKHLSPDSWWPNCRKVFITQPRPHRFDSFTRIPFNLFFVKCKCSHLNCDRKIFSWNIHFAIDHYEKHCVIIPLTFFSLY